MSPVLELLLSGGIGVEEETEHVLVGFGGGGSKFREAGDLGWRLTRGVLIDPAQYSFCLECFTIFCRSNSNWLGY